MCKHISQNKTILGITWCYQQDHVIISDIFVIKISILLLLLMWLLLIIIIVFYIILIISSSLSLLLSVFVIIIIIMVIISKTNIYIFLWIILFFEKYVYFRYIVISYGATPYPANSFDFDSPDSRRAWSKSGKLYYKTGWNKIDI